MSPTAIFKKALSDALLYYLEGAPSIDGYRIAYLPYESYTPPESITLKDSWKVPGHYIFLGNSPVDIKAFIVKFRSFIASITFMNTRFVWIDSPNCRPEDWHIRRLDIVKDSDENYFTSALLPFDLGNFSLFIGEGCPFRLMDEEDRFLITNLDNRIYFTTERGAQKLTGLGETITISFTSKGAGCFLFSLTLESISRIDSGVIDEQKVPDIDKLQVGMRCFVETAMPGIMKMMKYPLFCRETKIQLFPCLDPLHPLSPERTFFSFTDPYSKELDISSPPVATYYRTNLGHQISLAAANSQAKLVLAPASISGTEYYLIPAGDFLTSLGKDARNGSGLAGDGSCSLMCGLSGVEYIKFEAGRDILTFIPEQAAYAIGMYPAKGEEAKPELIGRLTTAWAYPRRPKRGDEAEAEAVVYCAQPDKSVLHKGNDQKSLFDSQTQSSKEEVVAIIDNALVYMEVPSSYLPAPDIADNVAKPFCFPMFPYAGGQGDLPLTARLESELISPERKRAINDIVQNHPAHPPASMMVSRYKADAEKAGVTPQGLVATYTDNYQTLAKVLLATTEPPLGKEESRLLLQNIKRDSPLWNALQSNQLMLVITDPESLKGHIAAENGSLRIGGWEFQLSPDNDNWRKDTDLEDTVLILKFFNDKTLQDLAAASTTWVMADKFNKDIKRAEEVIKKAINKALQKSSQIGCQEPEDSHFDAAPDFENFVYNVLQNPRWNGILALNVKVPPKDIPDQLKSLAAGIDKEKFFAHHVGVNASPVSYDAEKKSFKAHKSSVFGLINYDDPGLPGASIDYSFKVLSLKVLFENSAVARFASQVGLQVNTLFGEQVTLQGASDNNLIFDGIYEDHDGHPSYVFLNQQVNLFQAAQSPVIDKVILHKGQFITVNPEAKDDKIKSRFVFWGRIDFKVLQGLDAFSFGSEEGSEGGLAVSNMAIEMDFDRSNPEMKIFFFDSSHLSFDLSGSQSRAHSLYSHFPLKLASFLTSTADVMPPDQGYMSISSPLKQGTLTYPWYGLRFDLDLGSPGALAEQVGFVASLLVAWSPSNGGDYNVFLGLKLPGSSGGNKEISLQGLLKIKIKAIELMAVPGKDKDGKDMVSYILRLQTISLGFMGMSLPPSGRTDFLLFGKPESADKTLGWYAVYDKGVKPRPKKPVPIPGFDGNGGKSIQGGQHRCRSEL